MTSELDLETVDVEAALASDSAEELLQVWNLVRQRRVFVEAIKRHQLAGDQASVAFAEEGLSRLPEVTSLQALQANKRVVGCMIGWARCVEIEHAPTAGASWAEIGEALGVTKQAAHDFYRRRAEDRQRYLPELHDEATVAAVLGDSATTAGPDVLCP